MTLREIQTAGLMMESGLHNGGAFLSLERYNNAARPSNWWSAGRKTLQRGHLRVQTFQIPRSAVQETY